MRLTKSLAMLALLSSSLMLSACETEKVEVQKSPCVGLEGSPCGPKRTLNGNPADNA